MARKAGWQSYLELTRRQRNSLERRARKGNEEAIAKFNAYSQSIRTATNRRLKQLEKAGLDYGPAYNNLIHYLDTEYGTNRVPTRRQLGNDISEIRWVNDYAVKFLRSPNSTVKGMERSNYYRVEKLQEHEILPTEIEDDNGISKSADWKDFKDFLRFLGSEEVSTAIDNYGESDTPVDRLWDYWNRFDDTNRSSNLLLMKMALAQFNAGMKSFDEAMREVGVKIEDYRPRR